MDPTLEFLLALGIYLNFKIWFLFIIHRLTSFKEERQPPAEDEEGETGVPAKTTVYTMGMFVAAVMIAVGGIISFIENQTLSVSGMIIYLTSSLVLILCWFQYCIKISAQLNKPLFDKKIIRLSEIITILFLVFGTVLGLIYNVKFIPLTLFLAIDVFVLLRGIDKYFTDQ